MIAYFQDVAFAQPAWLALLGLLPPLALWYRWRYRRRFAPLTLPGSSPGTGGNGTDVPDPVRPTLRTRMLFLPPALRLLALAAISVALARPQTRFSEESITTEGIDIVLAMDVSTSMWAVDFRPNRMEAAKQTAAEFIEARPHDRIGLVVFAGEAFTQCPITLDHELLQRLVLDADAYRLEDGTAIGDGSWLALNRLIDSTSLQSKVIILLTDGVQTAGEFAPLDAAKAAADLGVRLYTIGIGSQTRGRIPVVDPRGRQIFELDPDNSFDEATLEEMARLTGGAYFRATSTDKLREIYREIDQLEKEKIDVNVAVRYEEKFYPLAWLAAGLLLLELLLAQTWLRTTT